MLLKNKDATLLYDILYSRQCLPGEENIVSAQRQAWIDIDRRTW
jgi:hypothetical protein